MLTPEYIEELRRLAEHGSNFRAREVLALLDALAAKDHELLFAEGITRAVGDVRDEARAELAAAQAHIADGKDAIYVLAECFEKEREEHRAELVAAERMSSAWRRSYYRELDVRIEAQAENERLRAALAGIGTCAAYSPCKMCSYHDEQLAAIATPASQETTGAEKARRAQERAPGVCEHGHTYGCTHCPECFAIKSAAQEGSE